MFEIFDIKWLKKKINIYKFNKYTLFIVLKLKY